MPYSGQKTLKVETLRAAESRQSLPPVQLRDRGQRQRRGGFKSGVCPQTCQVPLQHEERRRHAERKSKNAHVTPPCGPFRSEPINDNNECGGDVDYCPRPMLLWNFETIACQQPDEVGRATQGCVFCVSLKVTSKMRHMPLPLLLQP